MSYGDRWRAMTIDERASWLRSEVTIFFVRGEQEDADAVEDGVSLFLHWTEDDAPRGKFTRD